ncbi:MAG: hypothetical protein IK083_04015 [Abditibacteriota bacterium]|nr:hypothetical protein [Abditibacteriota bacterium]
MKRSLCLFFVSALLLVAAGAVFGETDPSVQTNKNFGKVKIQDVDNTGLVKNYLTIRSKNDFRPGVVEEELPVDEDTTVIFRYVSETGLDESEIQIPGSKPLRYSCRKTLQILQRDWQTGQEENLQSSVVKMYENDSLNEDLKTLRFNYPYVLDAILSDDGKILRCIMSVDPSETEVCELHLDEKNWRYQTLIKHRRQKVFGKYAVPFSGNMVQAYFVLPDVINVSCDTGMLYSVRICEKDALGLTDPDGRDLGVLKRMCLDCVYWNEVGKRDYLKLLFSKELVFDDETNKYVMKGCLDKTLTVEPPVPTEKDWEGWRKLLRGPKDK